MPQNNRQVAAQEIWKLQNGCELRPKSYNTVYNRLIWDDVLKTYRFLGRQDTYSYSPIENIV